MDSVSSQNQRTFDLFALMVAAVTIPPTIGFCIRFTFKKSKPFFLLFPPFVRTTNKQNETKLVLCRGRKAFEECLHAYCTVLYCTTKALLCQSGKRRNKMDILQLLSQDFFFGIRLQSRKHNKYPVKIKLLLIICFIYFFNVACTENPTCSTYYCIVVLCHLISFWLKNFNILLGMKT